MAFKGFKTTLIVLSTIFPYCPGETIPAGSLGAWVDQAVARHPAVMAAEKTARAERAKVASAGAPGDPMVMVEFMKLPVSGATPMGETAFSVTESLPFPVRLGWLAARQRAQAEVARATHGARVREVRRDVVRSLLAVAVAEEDLRVARTRVAQWGLMESVVTARYGSGRATQTEWGRVKVMAAMARSEAQMKEGERTVALIAVERFGAVPSAVTQGPSFFSTPVSALVGTREDWVRTALASFPEVRMQTAMEARMGAEGQAMKWEWAPDLTVKGTWTRMEAGDVNGAVGVGLSIPLWFAARQAPNGLAADLLVSAEGDRTVDVKRQVTAMVSMAVAMHGSSRRALEVLLDAAAPQARQAVDVALKDYQVDRIAFSELVETLRAVTDTELEILKARKSLAEAAITLAYLTGETVPGSPW